MDKSFSLPNGWERELLPDGSCKITVPHWHVGIRPSTKELKISNGYPFEVGDFLVIKGRVGGIITHCKLKEGGWAIKIETNKDIVWEVIRR